MAKSVKPLHWIASSLEDLKECPSEVQDEVGYALFLAQDGKKHNKAKPLKGFGGAGVLEVISNFDGDTFRAVYTVKLRHAVYALHVFQKKSKKGIATPKCDMETVKRSLKIAELDHLTRYEEVQNEKQ